MQDSDVATFQKLLDMKGMKKTEQTPFIDLFRARVSQMQESSNLGHQSHGASSGSGMGSFTDSSGNLVSHHSTGDFAGSSSNPGPSNSHPHVENESSRMKKLEKLIKRKL